MEVTFLMSFIRFLQFQDTCNLFYEIKHTSVFFYVRKWVFCGIPATVVLVYMCPSHSHCSSFAFLPIGLSNPAQIHYEMEWKENRGVGWGAYSIFPSLRPPSYFCDLIGPNLSASLSQPHTINLHLFKKRDVCFSPPSSFFDYARVVF
jgi:hypothetical protein